MSEFSGKVAIVTGASSVIGRMNALFYAREVAELVVWLRSKRASFVNCAFYKVDGGYLAL